MRQVEKKCHRCGNRLHKEIPFGPESTIGENGGYSKWQCTQCGHTFTMLSSPNAKFTQTDSAPDEAAKDQRA